MPTGHYMPEPKRQDCFRAGTAARVGKQFKVCETILVPTVGTLSRPGWFCIRFCLIQRTPKSSGSGFRRLVSLRQRMAAGPGIDATDYQIRSRALNTPIPQRPATAKSDIATTTGCGHQAPLTCVISKIMTASGVLPMVVGVGTTSLVVFRQRSVFRSAFIHGTQKPSGLCL